MEVIDIAGNIVSVDYDVIVLDKNIKIIISYFI